MGGQRAARCLQAGTSVGPGAEDGSARERRACKGSAVAGLLLTVRGSSCRRREPGSANPNTEPADNKPCAPAALPSISGVRGACWRRAIPSSHPPRCQGGEGAPGFSWGPWAAWIQFRWGGRMAMPPWWACSGEIPPSARGEAHSILLRPPRGQGLRRNV